MGGLSMCFKRRIASEVENFSSDKAIAFIKGIDAEVYDSSTLSRAERKAINTMYKKILSSEEAVSFVKGINANFDHAYTLSKPQRLVISAMYKTALSFDDVSVEVLETLAAGSRITIPYQATLALNPHISVRKKLAENRNLSSYPAMRTLASDVAEEVRDACNASPVSQVMIAREGSLDEKIELTERDGLTEEAIDVLALDKDPNVLIGLAGRNDLTEFAIGTLFKINNPDVQEILENNFTLPQSQNASFDSYDLY